ncbi:hypothetical protein V6N12_054357 [Hibiscus sabdariffa]|uniref:F-box domain-containing protein n=1 Tax=Hibiscus sabdariffa TaxID=183260 RepID=A0ABR2D066_9ROSI
MAACRQRSCWSQLPRDLLSCISQHLDSRLHVLRFRAVCSSWRASVPLPPKSPSLPKQLHFRGFEAVSDQKFWVIKVEETRQPNKFNVLSPFSRHPINNMPPSFSKELNLLSFCVEETATAFSIRQRREDPDTDVDDHNPLIRKIKLASDFVSSKGAVAISRGNLCRVTSDERDENTFSLEEFRSTLDQMASECGRYFVESGGHLYLVVRDLYICSDHVEVTDLGDQVFFVSTDCSFSFSTQDSKGCHGNCIIYVDEITDVEHLENKERYEEDDDDNELWHLKNGRVGLFNLADQSSGSLELFPEYLAMFWPPPTWLMGDQTSSSS